MQARLILIDPPAARRELKLALPATVGRSRDAKIKVIHAKVSRLHCEFFERDGLLYVRDLDSTNGTYVGDQRIREAAVPPGQTVTMGAVKFQAMYEPAKGAILPAAGFAATETVGKAGEATFRTELPPSSERSASEADAFGTTPAGLSGSVEVDFRSTTTANEAERPEGSFDWFDELTTEQAEAPVGGGEATPSLPAGERGTNRAEEAEPLNWDELELEELGNELPAAQTELVPTLPADAALDESLNILPPVSETAAAAPPPPELQWHVPEPSAPAEAGFAFHVEQPHETPPPPTPAPEKPAATDDADLEKFFKRMQ